MVCLLHLTSQLPSAVLRMSLTEGKKSWSVRDGGVTLYPPSVASGCRQRQGAVARDRTDVWEAQLSESKDHTVSFSEVIRRTVYIRKLESRRT